MRLSPSVVQAPTDSLTGTGRGLAEGGEPFGLWRPPEAPGAFLLFLKAYKPGSASPGFHLPCLTSAPGQELRF